MLRLCIQFDKVYSILEVLLIVEVKFVFWNKYSQVFLYIFFKMLSSFSRFRYVYVEVRFDLMKKFWKFNKQDGYV